MKKNTFYTFALLGGIVLLFTQCKKDSDTGTFIVPAKYSTITLKGPAVVAIPVGGTYTDSGATVTDSLANPIVAPVDSTNTDVNPAKPGFYAVNYYTRNKYGFETYAQRLVLVSNVPDSINLAGTYKRTSNQVPITLTKVGPGLYKVLNPGGVDPANPTSGDLPLIEVYLGNTSGDTIASPGQITSQVGAFDLTEENYQPGDSTHPAQLSWIVIANGFGTSRRTFIKQ